MIILSNILKIVFIVFFFGFCVFIHEFGHLIIALWQGLHVEKFSIGMGPKLFGFTYKGVEYVVSWLPFGGYVSLPQLDPTDTPKTSNGSLLPFAPPKARALTAFAGPLFNVLFGFVLATLMWWAGLWRPLPITAYNVLEVPVYLDNLPEGLESTDIILKANGQTLPSLPYNLPATWENVSALWSTFFPEEDKPESTICLTVLDKNQEQHDITVEATPNPEWTGGLRPGDRIVKVNGVSLKDEQQFKSEYLFNKNEFIHIQIVRGRKSMDISYAPAPNPAMEGLGYPFFAFSKPVHVAEVQEKSPAESIGLKKNDFILAVNSKNTLSVHELNQFFEGMPGGAAVTMDIIREGKTQQLEGKLTTGCRDSAAFGLKFHVFIDHVTPDSPAEHAGLKAHDLIEKVEIIGDDSQIENTLHVTSSYELSSFIASSGSSPLRLTYRRGEQPCFATVTAQYNSELGRNIIGISLSDGNSSQNIIMHISPWTQFSEIMGTTVRTLGLLFNPITSRAKGVLTGRKVNNPSAQISVRHMSGPIGIVTALWYKLKMEGYRGGMAFIILITFSLAFMNLLPLPVLDGGHIVFAGIEAALRRRLPAKTINWLYNIFACMLIALMLYITFYDGKRLMKIRKSENAKPVLQTQQSATPQK